MEDEKITVKKQLDEAIVILQNIAHIKEDGQYDSYIVTNEGQKHELVSGYQRMRELADVLETNTLPLIYELLGIELED